MFMVAMGDVSLINPAESAQADFTIENKTSGFRA